MWQLLMKKCMFYTGYTLVCLRKINRLKYTEIYNKSKVLPVWIFTRNSLDVNWSLTVKTWSGSMSRVFGSFESTRWVILPSASDCSDRARSRSGMSVSFLISWQQYTTTLHTCLQRRNAHTLDEFQWQQIQHVSAKTERSCKLCKCQVKQIIWWSFQF